MMRAVPEDASVLLAGHRAGGTRRRAGSLCRRKTALQGQRRTHRLLLTAALPEGIYRDGGGPLENRFQPPV